MENSLDNQESTIQRGPNYSTLETNTLLDYVEKYKSVILNPSVTSVVSRAKELTWKKICNEYNSKGYYERSSEDLKNKWNNLKKTARKCSIDQYEANDAIKKTIELINESDKCKFDILDVERVFEEDDNNVSQSSNKKDCSFESTVVMDGDPAMDDNLDSTTSQDTKMRSFNFTPQECSILLQCVKAEKKYVFCKETNLEANKLKNQAWNRITDSFNKRNSLKRPLKVLHTKFDNMKKMAKQHGLMKDEILLTEKIKTETFEFEDDLKESQAEHIDETVDEPDSFGHIDPLSTGSHSDNDELFCRDTFLQQDYKDIVNMKMEILKYQFETAKLERQRVQEAIDADRLEHQSRREESEIRLKTEKRKYDAAAFLGPC